MNRKKKNITSNVSMDKTTIGKHDVEVNVETMESYMDYHFKVNPKDYDLDKVVKESKKSLFSTDTPVEMKKKLLFLLAHYPTFDSYNVVKDYINDENNLVRDWAVLAMQEIQAFVEGGFYDEGSEMVVSPLGGKNNKVRHYLIFSTRDNIPFSKDNRDNLTDFVEWLAKEVGVEIENMEFTGAYVVLKVLFPIDIPVNFFVDEILISMKEILNFTFFATNVKKPTKGDIMDYLDEIYKEDKNEVKFDIYRREDDKEIKRILMDNDLSEQEANNYIQDFHEMESCNDHFVFLAKQDAKVMCLIELGYEIDLFQGFILDIFISENMSGDEVFTDLLDFSESILTNRAIESIKIRFALADAIADHDYWFDSGYDFDEKEDEYAKSLV